MKLLPRRTNETAETADTDAAESPPPVAGKGRPTPKRRERVVQRGPVTPPKTRKEAAARQKQQSKAARAARATPAAQMTAQQRRQALRAGDPSVLPRRDQGSTRKLARDWVDSNRMFSNYLLLLFPLLLLSWLIPLVQFLVIAVFLGLLVEWYLVGRRLRAMAIERFGSAQGGAMSIGFYAGSRAYLPRRWRLPAPQVELGEQI